MNRTQLVENVSKTTGLDKKQAEAAVTAFVDSVVSETKAGNKVSIFGFGSFTPKSRAARTGRNPQTGAPVKIAASKSVGFTPAAAYKATLNTRGGAKKAAAKKAAPAKRGTTKAAAATKSAATKTAATKSAATKSAAKSTARTSAAKSTAAKSTAAKSTAKKATTARKTAPIAAKKATSKTTKKR